MKKPGMLVMVVVLMSASSAGALTLDAGVVYDETTRSEHIGRCGPSHQNDSTSQWQGSIAS